MRELLVGHDVIRNERIKTASIGQAQLLFTDQSTLTVARNSEVVIDEFVFDPQKQTGNLAATVTTGVFRYVGGKISKQKDVTFYTPTGAVSVRGGIVLIQITGNSVHAFFMFGDHMAMTVNGVTQTTTKFNTSISSVGGGPPGAPVPFNNQTIQSLSLELQSNKSNPNTFSGVFSFNDQDVLGNLNGSRNRQWVRPLASWWPMTSTFTVRLRMIFTRWPTLRTSRMTARTRSPG